MDEGGLERSYEALWTCEVTGAERVSVLAGDFRACDHHDLRGEISQIHVPALVLVGDEDKMTPLAFSEELAAGIPDAALQVVRNSGHMLPLEQPAETFRLVRSFLDEVYRF